MYKIFTILLPLALMSILLASCSPDNEDNEAVVNIETKTMQLDVTDINGRAISTTFEGKLFDPALQVPMSSDSKVKDETGISSFFTRMYQANMSGKMQSMRSVWHPNEHDRLASTFTAEDLKMNKERFEMIKELGVSLIIKSEEFYICYLEVDFTSFGRQVLVFPVTKKDGEYFLINSPDTELFEELKWAMSEDLLSAAKSN